MTCWIYRTYIARMKFVALALEMYFTSKRKVVEQAPSGMYVMESSIVFIIEFFFIITLMGASILTQTLARISTTVLIITASTAAALTLGLREALTKLMERYDIAT